MSDFLYSSVVQPEGQLAARIQGIYFQDKPNVSEFHGEWGSLAVSDNIYQGFQPIETEEYVFIVIGGPVLCWQGNDFLVGDDQFIGAKAIFNRWLKGELCWDEDLHGPFVILVVEKKKRKIHVITDLLMFIPVYECQQDAGLFIGTHIDALAHAAGLNGEFDLVSLADFVLNSAITYPYTAYTNILQSQAACESVYDVPKDAGFSIERNIYWLPCEDNMFTNANDAAEAVREGMKKYVERITESMTEVAQFISGGEDTRAVSALLPERLKRDAYIFLDSMNREGRIAERITEIYGASFTAETRDLTHYLRLLPEATSLIGTGLPYGHAHTLGFHKKCRLTEYPAVFGGYLADSFLKGLYSNKPKIVNRFAFLPDIVRPGETRSAELKYECFEKSVLSEIDQRRRAHLKFIEELRPGSAHEWFAMYPATMMITIPNVYTNRRLFRSYEPFMCNEVIKIGAAVPLDWKLNRRLFNKIAKPLFRKSRWVSHTRAHLPYFSWWVNAPIQFATWAWLHVARRVGLQKGLQGPWSDWRKVMQSDEWRECVEDAWQGGSETFSEVMKIEQVEDFLNSNELGYSQKINFLQTLQNLQAGSKSRET